MIFDISTISDPALKDQYDRLKKRGESTAGAIQKAYSLPSISIDFDSSSDFNASAGSEGKGYAIRLNSAVPLLIYLVFEKLFSFPTILPEISSTDEPVSDYSVPFIVDPGDINARQEWEIQLTELRSFTARMLADISMTYILLHEFGHVLCGHVEGNKHYNGSSKILELNAMPSTGDFKSSDRNQAWEYDADAVAVTLLMRYVEELMEDIDKNERTKKVFYKGEDTLPHILSLFSVSLFALFSYVRGARYKLNRYSSHPHPMVRSFYIKDMLVKAAEDLWPLNRKSFISLQDERLEEFFLALEELELIDGKRFSEGYMDSINGELSRLRELQACYRESCAEWTWIGWEK